MRARAVTHAALPVLFLQVVTEAACLACDVCQPSRLKQREAAAAAVDRTVLSSLPFFLSLSLSLSSLPTLLLLTGTESDEEDRASRVLGCQRAS